MNRFPRPSLLVLLLFLLCSASASGHDLILRLSDRSEIPFSSMIDDMAKASVVYVGEQHDNPVHHDLQLRVIRTLHERRIPVAIGLEMFSAASQNALDRWVSGRSSTSRFRKEYERQWNMPWDLYAGIFRYARRERIPMVGLNIPRELTKKVAREGFESLTAGERRAIPPGITCELDDAYMTMVRRAFATHDTGDKAFRHFCEAQILWNRSMAYYLVEFMKKEPKRVMVVVTGNGHAMRGGMPREVERFRKGIVQRILLSDPQREIREVAADDGDYLWVSH